MSRPYNFSLCEGPISKLGLVTWYWLVLSRSYGGSMACSVLWLARTDSDVITQHAVGLYSTQHNWFRVTWLLPAIEWRLNHGGPNTSGFKSRWRVFTMVRPDTNQRSSIKPRLMKPFLDQSDMVMVAHRQNTTFWKRSFPRSAFTLVRPQDERGLDDHCTRKSWKIRYKGFV